MSLRASTRQLTAIIGPNGSGKTNVLRALTAEIAPAQGRITLNGRAIEGQSPAALPRQRAVLPSRAR
ncbi:MULTISPECIES: ATP-binding cassette domain-containing protein [Paracoccus]|uniref:ATP-binding cassette domain-containing protein n=1 Tax=Paracoccus TaxID=265 RepID=UPI00269BFD91